MKCISKLGQTNKEDLVPISHNINFGDFNEFLVLRKIQGENANKNNHVHKAMVLLHIRSRNLGIPSLGYPGNSGKNQILMLIKF